MNIEKVLSVREKYSEGFRRQSSDISQVVIHGTGGGRDADALIAWMLGGERAKQYNRGIALFHYLIDYDGKIYEIIDPEKWVYHSSSGRHDMRTIGIEHMNRDSQNKSPYTKEQYKSSLYLITDYLMKNYNITSIIGHGACKDYYSGSYKNCPGNYDWTILMDELISQGYDFKHEKEYIKEIIIERG